MSLGNVGDVVVGDQVKVVRRGRGPVDDPQELEPFLAALRIVRPSANSVGKVLALISAQNDR